MDGDQMRAEHRMLSLLALRVDRSTLERFVLDTFESWSGSASAAEHAQAIEYLAGPLERGTLQHLAPNQTVMFVDEILSSGVPWDAEAITEAEREYGQPMLLYVSIVILHLFRCSRASGIDALLSYPVVFTQVVRCTSAIGDSELHAAVAEYLRVTVMLWKDEELYILARLASCLLNAMTVGHDIASCIAAMAASPRIADQNTFWNSEPLAPARSLIVGDIRRVAAVMREAGESAARFASSIDPSRHSGR